MTKSFTGRKRIRRTFGRIAEVTQMPNLIEVQKTSYDQFLQMGIKLEDRERVGLQEVFVSVFPIRISRSGPSCSSCTMSWKSPSTTSRSASSAA